MGSIEKRSRVEAAIRSFHSLPGRAAKVVGAEGTQGLPGFGGRTVNAPLRGVTYSGGICAVRAAAAGYSDACKRRALAAASNAFKRDFAANGDAGRAIRVGFVAGVRRMEQGIREPTEQRQFRLGSSGVSAEDIENMGRYEEDVKALRPDKGGGENC